MKSEPEEIYIVGYPHSGNTWAALLVADAMDCPIQSKGKNQKSYADGFLERKSDYIVRQMHIRTPPSPYNAKVIYIYRDPRDVCVSAFHYFKKKYASLREVVHVVGNGMNVPLRYEGGWCAYHNFWHKHLATDWAISYEELHKDTYKTLTVAFHEIGLEPLKDLNGVVERNTFQARRYFINNNKNKISYNHGLQIHHLRKGIVGDWKNHFNKALGELADAYFGLIMLDLGYTDDRYWWQNLP